MESSAHFNSALFSMIFERRKQVVYFWGFYDIKFKLTQYKAKLGLIPQYS